MRRLILSLLLALCAWGAAAREAVPLAADAAVEERLLAIADELRCLVCQNESLAASRAELAQDLRREIRTLIKDGKTDPEILDFLVTRYGDFVRYRPPLNPSTWLHWLGPFVLLAGALAALIRHVIRPRRAEITLSSADRARAAALLAGER